MKKLLIIGSLFIILSGCDSTFPGSLVQQNTTPTTPVVNTPSTTTTTTTTTTPTTTTPVATDSPDVIPTTPTPATPATQLYRNDAYNFELTYPKELGFVTPNYANLENKVVQLQIGADAYPKTNFDDAGIAVSTGFAKSEKECQDMNLPEGSAGFKDTVNINGVTFDATTGAGAGAGNLYESKVYRRLHGSFCYEITETIHTANIGNFDPGTVTEIDKAPIWNKLEAVTQTFKFLD